MSSPNHVLPRFFFIPLPIVPQSPSNFRQDGSAFPGRRPFVRVFASPGSRWRGWSENRGWNRVTNCTSMSRVAKGTRREYRVSLIQGVLAKALRANFVPLLPAPLPTCLGTCSRIRIHLKSLLNSIPRNIWDLYMGYVFKNYTDSFIIHWSSEK